MLDLLKGTRIVSFNHFLMGPMGVQYPVSYTHLTLPTIDSV